MTNMSDALQSLMVFDEQSLQRLEALDPSGQNRLLERVMKAFELSLMRMSTQLAAAQDQHDLVGMRHVVHTLKSSAASVGALRLAQMCLDIETGLRGLSPADVPCQSALVADSVAGVLVEMRRVHAAVPALLERAHRLPQQATTGQAGGQAGAASAGH
jgi:HPt (histidine-containing phosphotransfer) domain-containing protein